MSEKKDETKVNIDTNSIDEQLVENGKISDEETKDVSEANSDEKNEEIKEDLKKAKRFMKKDKLNGFHLMNYFYVSQNLENFMQMSFYLKF